MGREIKFRVWSKVFKKFTDGYENENRVSYDELYSDPPGLFFGGLRSILRDQDYVLQQYTGLKDRTGIEIYEGDIIRHHSGRFGVVEWISESDGYDSSGWNMKNSKWGDGIDGTVIIGNIFENPELVNE